MSSTSSAQSSLRSPPTHQYPKEIQLKIYQAFIFSIPILFSIILVLLFYLFYLKRRRSPSAPPPPVLPITVSNVASCDDSKAELKNKLTTISLVECMKTRDDSSSLCCVCLGEFDTDKDESLVQVASCCEHMFHSECIQHWLRSNATCPLCRAPIHHVEISSHDHMIIRGSSSSANHIYNYSKFPTSPLNITTDLRLDHHHCVTSHASSSSVC